MPQRADQNQVQFNRIQAKAVAPGLDLFSEEEVKYD